MRHVTSNHIVCGSENNPHAAGQPCFLSRQACEAHFVVCASTATCKLHASHCHVPGAACSKLQHRNCHCCCWMVAVSMTMMSLYVSQRRKGHAASSAEAAAERTATGSDAAAMYRQHTGRCCCSSRTSSMSASAAGAAGGCSWVCDHFQVQLQGSACEATSKNTSDALRHHSPTAGLATSCEAFCSQLQAEVLCCCFGAFRSKRAWRTWSGTWSGTCSGAAPCTQLPSALYASCYYHHRLPLVLLQFCV